MNSQAERARADLIDQLGTIELPSAERHPKYDREMFGDGWQFNTVDGCSTRETVLIRDLEQVVMRDDRKCKVLRGSTKDRHTKAGGPLVSGSSASASASGVDCARNPYFVSVWASI